MKHLLNPSVAWRFAFWLLLLWPTFNVFGASPRTVVPKWGLFEQAFKSSVGYSNALQDVVLTVDFMSPLGETTRVYGFWDGGRTWRVRFCPAQPGLWRFRTSCSDTKNPGLNDQIGTFTCSAPLPPNRFLQHGPVRVAKDGHHFEHADGTPFFWLADTVLHGARLSTPNEWELYVYARSDQKFTAALWAAAAGQDYEGESALTGFAEQIAINPAYFQRLDAKVAALKREGLLSVIVPLWESGEGQGLAMPVDQAILVTRYVVARYGAEPVAWLLPVESDTKAQSPARTKAIGEAVFENTAHAPVLVYGGSSGWVLDEFRNEKWADAFGLQTFSSLSDDALEYLFKGPAGREWTREPARPFIPFTPAENGLIAPGRGRFSTDDVRRAACWGLLGSIPAGLTYAGQGVADWDARTEPKSDKTPGAALPFWHKALFMPAAKQLGYLADEVESLPFWTLQPVATGIVKQPGTEAPRRQIVAAATPKPDLMLVYVPEDRTLELSLDSLPLTPKLSWFNPRDASTRPAVAVIGGKTCQFPTPGPGDWVLQVARGGTGSKP